MGSAKLAKGGGGGVARGCEGRQWRKVWLEAAMDGGGAGGGVAEVWRRYGEWLRGMATMEGMAAGGGRGYGVWGVGVGVGVGVRVCGVGVRVCGVGVRVCGVGVRVWVREQ